MSKDANNLFLSAGGWLQPQAEGGKGNDVARFPQEVTDFCQTLNRFIAQRTISMSEVMHSLSKAEPFLKSIGFDSYDVDELKMSFFKGKIRDLRDVYSGYKITDLETDLQNCHQEVSVQNHIAKIGERYNLKLDDATNSINFKETAKPDILKKFKDFKREYERYVSISSSPSFMALKLQNKHGMGQG